MSDALTITARFLQPYSHGRGEDGSAEWPPSPLRLFQALVAPALGFSPDEDHRRRAIEALRWLERRAPPEIIAPPAASTAGYRLFVPDNVGDRVARSWASGRPADIADYRTEKDVQPVRLAANDDCAVHYVFRDVDGLPPHFEILRAMARRMTHLGWGVDLIVGDAAAGPVETAGERWIPGRGGHRSLRCPVPGTLAMLEQKHEQFLTRIEGDRFRPVAPLTAFCAWPYARPKDPLRRPVAAFRLLNPRNPGKRLWLDPRRHARSVAAWLRHAVDEVSTGWPFGSNSLVVHGHAEDDATAYRARFSYLPLPSITPMGTEWISRVLVLGAPGLEPQLDWIRHRLAGMEVSWDGQPRVIFEPLPAGDRVLGQYDKAAACWSTVTPVVLPGYHDGSQRKTERLLLKAFAQAGFEADLIDAIRDLEWNNTGFRRGVQRAGDYLRPDKVQGPLLHVRVRFGCDVAGPFAIGSGRHRGLGVFAVAE